METKMDPYQKQILDDAFDAFSIISEEGFVSLMHVAADVTRHSSSAVEMFGLPDEYVEHGAYNWLNYLHPSDRRHYQETMDQLLEGKAHTYDITYRLRLKSGEYDSFRALGAALRGPEGTPVLIGGIAFNSDKMKDMDPVTILPNQNAFKKDLSTKINAGINTISLQIGIGRFSTINQKYGYSYGNRILQETAFLIREIVKDRGEIYRLEGPNFAIRSETTSREELSAIYDMIRYRLQRGVQVNGIRNIISASGGLISTLGSNADSGAVVTCLNYAYEESKHHRQGELVDFNGTAGFDTASSIGLISTIRDSILDDFQGFSMEYLPVYHAETQEVLGAETVITWENETYGRVQREDFMPILERDFIFEELGDFATHQALLDGVAILKTNPSFLLCLNVYRLQLESGYFRENLFNYLEETGFPPSLLSIKLAADCRSMDIHLITEIIESLHRKRILVVVDGFGSGTNSIVFLKNAPVDAVDIDPQFLNGIERPGRDRDILEYLTRMAATCVEHININGVDSKKIREALRYIPLTTMQGSYLSEPLSRDELIHLL